MTIRSPPLNVNSGELLGAERPADAGEQPLLARGFRDYSGDARELLRTGRLTGEDDDIELGCQSRQVLQDFAARHDRHRQIEQDQRNRRAQVAHLLQRRPAVRNIDHTIPSSFQHFPRDAADALLVLHEKNDLATPALASAGAGDRSAASPSTLGRNTVNCVPSPIRLCTSIQPP